MTSFSLRADWSIVSPSQSHGCFSTTGGPCWPFLFKAPALFTDPVSSLKSTFGPSLSILLLAASVSCSATRTIDLADGSEAAASVVNAVEVGLSASSFLVVSRVDGVSVHRKFDRDRGVRLGPGQHRVAVRFYRETLSGRIESRRDCVIDFRFEARTQYFLSAEFSANTWRGWLNDDGGVPVAECRFEASTIGHLDGKWTGAMSALQPEPVVLDGRTATGDGEGLPEALGTAAVGANSAQVHVPRQRAGAPQLEDQRRGVLARATDVMAGSGHRGCRDGRFRVRKASDGILALSGNETVRLIGVDLERSSGVDRILSQVVGACVAIELDDVFIPQGHRDRAGNLLAYVETEASQVLNLEIIRGGNARVDPKVRVRHLGRLLAAQADARAAGIGVWSAN